MAREEPARLITIRGESTSCWPDPEARRPRAVLTNLNVDLEAIRKDEDGQKGKAARCRPTCRTRPAKRCSSGDERGARAEPLVRRTEHLLLACCGRRRASPAQVSPTRA